MYRDANLMTGAGEFYFRVSLGGKERQPSSYYTETKFYLRRGPFEFFRGLTAYQFSILNKYGVMDFMVFHSRSAHPRRVQFILHIFARKLARDIKRGLRGLR